MKIYHVIKTFMVSSNLYYQVPEGTIFIYGPKYKAEIDKSRYPPIINLTKDKFNQIKKAANGNIREIEIKDEKIEKILSIDKERRKNEAKIKSKLRDLTTILNEEIFYLNND
ncbi:MAG: hypothetical protein Q7S27_02520 [Nanoarchaeota archaeon]|nr:hypothetical protein [Nanoarchaeota archaeon]